MIINFKEENLFRQMIIIILLMFDNIKEQSHQAISKVLQSVKKYELQKAQSTNPETEEVVCSQLIDVHSHSLQQSQKMLITILFRQDIQKKFTDEQFKQKMLKIQKELNLTQNQFKQEKHFSEPTIALNKTIRKYKKKEIKKEQSNPQADFHPEYYRIDQQICHKLFLTYRNLSVGIPDKGLKISFQEIERYKECMNYHKVLEILKDANITLEIHQKLQILRSIKKFCISPNFITEEEFVKVFKMIVHSLGYKEKVFYDLVNKKSVELSLSKPPKPRNKILSKDEGTRKNYKFKTQGSVTGKRDYHTNLNTSKLIVDEITMRKHTDSQIRSRVDPIKSIIEKGKVNFNSNSNKKSYLTKAMDAEKISKITWQSLFSMNESNMHNNIVIPDIVRGKI